MSYYGWGGCEIYVRVHTWVINWRGLPFVVFIWHARFALHVFANCLTLKSGASFAAVAYNTQQFACFSINGNRRGRGERWLFGVLLWFRSLYPIFYAYYIREV
jgi:hypothetical protein